jgi:hypothetical protein
MGITPVVFSPMPQNGKNIGECLVRAEFFGGDLNTCGFKIDESTDASKEVHEFLQSIAKHHKVVFIDEKICDNGICKAYIDKTFIYRDSKHLSQSGSALLGKQMGFYDLIVENK